VQRQVRADITPLPLVGARRGWVMAAALTAIFIDQSASSIASSTLSSVQGAFGLGPDEGSWFVTLENAPYYASIIASVWMVARIGRKPVLVASLLGYALFSLLCIVAPDATTLLVLRFLQGVAQGGIFTTALLVIFTMHKPREVAKALMPFSAASQAGGVLGPLVGGSLVEWGYWTDAFAWSSVVSILAAAVVIWQLPHHGRHHRIPYDPIGLLLAVAMFVPFQYLVNEGERRNWFEDGNVTLATIALIVLIATFVHWERKLAPHPLFDVRILKRRDVALGGAIAVFLAIAGYSTTLFVQYAQADAGFSPTEAGLVVGGRIVGIVIGVFAIGTAVLRGWTTARSAIALGGVVYLAGVFALASLMTSTEDLAAYLPLTLAVGLIQGVANQPLPGLTLGGLRQGDFAMGLVAYKLGPLLGFSIANAFSQRTLDVFSAQHLSDLAGDVTLQNAAVAAYVHDGGGSRLASLVAAQATTLAYADTTRWLAVLGVGAIVLALFLRVARRS
jgi:DHA2 family multidrug resistance protein